MKKLLTEWRKFLAEGTDPRIQKQINMLLALPKGIGIVGDSEDSFGMSFKYAELHENGYDTLGDDGNDEGIPYGSVDIMETESDAEGPCFGGFTVIGSSAAKGWGPLLYEVAIEWASQEGGGLTADRFSVSDNAQAVWDKYGKRGDVSGNQMDVSHNPEGAGARLNKTVPQLTPDDESDDCDQARAISKHGPDWHKDPTTRMYKKDNPEVMQALKAAGRLFIA